MHQSAGMYCVWTKCIHLLTLASKKQEALQINTGRKLPLNVIIFDCCTSDVVIDHPNNVPNHCDLRRYLLLYLILPEFMVVMGEDHVFNDLIWHSGKTKLSEDCTFANTGSKWVHLANAGASRIDRQSLFANTIS